MNKAFCKADVRAAHCRATHSRITENRVCCIIIINCWQIEGFAPPHSKCVHSHFLHVRSTFQNQPFNAFIASLHRDNFSQSNRNLPHIAAERAQKTIKVLQSAQVCAYHEFLRPAAIGHNNFKKRIFLLEAVCFQSFEFTQQTLAL